MSTSKDHDRHSSRNLAPDVQDKIFACPEGIVDLSRVNIIHSRVDTVRQLYRGELRQELLERLEKENEAKEQIVEVEGRRFALGRMGKNSGFRYRLQNNDDGVIILLGSYYAKTNQEGAHLKIELSPKFILDRSTQQIRWQYIDATESTWPRQSCHDDALHPYGT